MPFEGEVFSSLEEQLNLTFHFKRHVYSVQKSILLSLKHPQSQQSGGWLPMDGQLSIRTRGMVAIPPKRFVFIQRYRALLFARSSLFCSSSEQIKTRSSMGGIWRREGGSLEELALPAPPRCSNQLLSQDPVISFLFHANELKGHFRLEIYVYIHIYYIGYL